jgi:hypothetical protein
MVMVLVVVMVVRASEAGLPQLAVDAVQFGLASRRARRTPGFLGLRGLLDQGLHLGQGVAEQGLELAESVDLTHDVAPG